MESWNPDDLSRVGDADELGISSTRPDGSDRPFVTIWVVRVGEELFVRSAYGTEGAWYRRAIAAGAGRIRAGGVERAVTFTLVDSEDDLHRAIDAVYHEKYDRYGARYVDPVVGERAHASTLRLDPLPSANGASA